MATLGTRVISALELLEQQNIPGNAAFHHCADEDIGICDRLIYSPGSIIYLPNLPDTSCIVLPHSGSTDLLLPAMKRCCKAVVKD
jgi:hypothetical protein